MCKNVALALHDLMLADSKVLMGNADFVDIIKNNALFIDKSMFIKEFMKCRYEVSVILRPRGFGKTTNLSMLRSFLSRGANPEDFKKLAIYEDKEFMENHCGKYTVIYLELKNCKGGNIEEMKKDIWNEVGKMYSRHFHEIPDFNSDFDPSTEAWRNLPVPVNLRFYLTRLTTRLHYLSKTYSIVLIDDYDAPFNHARQHGFYREAENFFDSFLNPALKDNSALYVACLMGNTDVRARDMITGGMNNAIILDGRSKHFSQCFGFTAEEVTPHAGENLNDVVEWYGGYVMGPYRMINPVSFTNWLIDRELKPYWVEAGNTCILSSLLSKHVIEMLGDIIPLLLDQSYRIYVADFTAQCNFGNTNWCISIVWSFLVLSGYLSYQKIEENRVVYGNGFASIPNNEMRIYWKAKFKQILLGEAGMALFGGLPEALENFDLSAIQDIFQKIFAYPYYREFSSKPCSHLFVPGIIVVLLNDQTSTKISLHGSCYFDCTIVIEFSKVKKAVILRIQKSISASLLNSDADTALAQVIEENYVAGLNGHYCLHIGIAFKGEKVSELKSAQILA